MEIIIHQAILHVLDTTMDAPVLSGSGMEMTAEKTAYFQYHIEKLLASDDIRQCRPLPDSAFKNELEHNHDFVDLSCRIAGVLFDYMHAHTTIPGADLAVVDFTRDGEPWLGILKLNYKNGYTHYTENVEGAPVNSIIQQRACLPSQSGKVEEGALVNLTDYSMKLLEKKFDIDGHKDFYLSTVVFQYTTAQPEKKKLQAIQEAAVQAVQENYADQPHVEAQVAMLIANQAADNDNQVSIQQVRQQLEEEYPLAAVPFDDYVEKSDVLEAPEQPVTVTPARIRRMESRSIHTANGIEVKIPTELLNSDNEVEFLHYSMKLLEKKFDIDGHKDFYLSTVVFQYTTAQPEKKKLQAIQEAAVQAVQENYADQPHVEAQVAMLIANQAADNDNQVSIQQVRQQLEEEYPLAAVPFDDYVEKSDVLEAPEQPVTVTPARIRRMESRSIHTANGIEVKIPTELLNSDNEVEFLHSDDGSISLLIKNVIL